MLKSVNTPFNSAIQKMNFRTIVSEERESVGK